MQEKQQYGKVEIAIVKVLRKHPNGIRYNALKKECDKMLRSSSGKGVCIRTFDKHLKGLVGSDIVKRNEESRFKVYYELRTAETSELKELRSAIQKVLLGWRNDLSLTLKLSKALTHAGCKKKEELRKHNPEMETYMKIMCEGIVETAAMLAKHGLLMILEFNPAPSRFMVEEFTDTLQNVFRDAADFIEKVGEGQFFLKQFFREVQIKSFKEDHEKIQVHREEMEKIARKSGISIHTERD